MTTYINCDNCGKDVTDAPHKIKFEPVSRLYPVGGCGCFENQQKIERFPMNFDLCGECYDKALRKFQEFLSQE